MQTVQTFKAVFKKRKLIYHLLQNCVQKLFIMFIRQLLFSQLRIDNLCLSETVQNISKKLSRIFSTSQFSRCRHKIAEIEQFLLEHHLRGWILRGRTTGSSHPGGLLPRLQAVPGLKLQHQLQGLELQTILSNVFTFTQKAFSWLKAPTNAFTFEILLRH